mgnify:CR=1 FL=1
MTCDVTCWTCDALTVSLAYAYDALSRPISRNADTFAYNVRGEVVSATVGGNGEAHSYDHIGNAVLAASGGVTNAYAANSLNQYTQVGRAAPCPPTPDGGLGQAAPPATPAYDADGNLTAFGPWAYAYDAANRLVSVSSNGVPLVTNFYDAQSRRVRKVTPEATTTCFYDGWNLVEERIAHTNGISSTIHYYWGKDLSGALQGAGGVGGLLYLTIDGVPYVPNYDNIGNITRYLDLNGNTVAQYTYDAFGGTLSQSGSLSTFFRHRFSTKYLDVETGLYYYGYRFYSPMLMRWLNRDPIEEAGGLNLYCFCRNNSEAEYDMLGLSCKVGTFNVLRLHTWEKSAANGLSNNPELFAHGNSLMSRLGILGNMISLSSLSGNALANFQAFVDAMVSKGLTPNADAIARLRKLYEWLKQGPLTIYGELEYELCVCRSGRTEFQRQTPIEDNEEVFDGSDRIEVSRARSTLIKRMIKDMYRKLK